VSDAVTDEQVLAAKALATAAGPVAQAKFEGTLRRYIDESRGRRRSRVAPANV
jgi:hypothetical protein